MGNQESKLSPADLEQLRTETNLTEEAITKVYDGFIKNHPSGKITKHEMMRTYRDLFPAGDPAPFAERMFDLYDTDKNGHIDFREFMTRVSLLAKGTADEKLHLVFRSYDTDNDGHISKSEFQKLVMALYKVLDPLESKTDDEAHLMRSSIMFERLDKNANDKVTFEEFKKAARKDVEFRVVLSQILENAF